MKTYEDVVEALETEMEEGIEAVRMTMVPCICVLCGEPYETQPVLRVVFDGASEASFICPDRIACGERQGTARQVVVDAVTLLPEDDAPEQTDEELAGECDRLAGELRNTTAIENLAIAVEADGDHGTTLAKVRDGSNDAPEGDE